MCPRAILVVAALAVASASSSASAERVALLTPFSGDADAALLRDAEAACRQAFFDRRDALATDHEMGVALARYDSNLPTTTDELLELGRHLRVDYVVTGRVTPLAGQYALVLTTLQVADGRSELLESTVVLGQGSEVIRGMLDRLVRAQGLGEEPPIPPNPPEPPPTARVEPQAAREPGEGAQRRARGPVQEARTEALPRLSYTPDDPFGLRGGLGLGVFLGGLKGGRGGATFLFRGQFAYTASYTYGIEGRAGLEAGFGTTGSLALLVGGGMTPPILRGVPLYVGGGVDLGIYLNVSGAHATGFELRPSARVVYILREKFELGLEPIGLTLLFVPGGTAVVFEMNAFFGYRFQLQS